MSHRRALLTAAAVPAVLVVWTGVFVVDVLRRHPLVTGRWQAAEDDLRRELARGAVAVQDGAERWAERVGLGDEGPW